MLGYAILLIIIAALLVVAYSLFRKIRALSLALEDLGFRKASQSVKYGKLTEQFLPFTDKFPFAPENFRFMGTPIDGVAFDEDKIYFCEFKASGSGLSAKQKNIKKQVQEKRVEWFEARLD